MYFALIGGTGVDNLALDGRDIMKVDTPYGMAILETGRLGDTDIVFVKRHGEQHSVPPHLINFRANIWSLKKIGIKKILATGAVGSISPDFKVGDIVLTDQFLDFTKSRPQTFFEGGDRGVLHIDLTEPYCPDLRKKLAVSAKELGIELKKGGVYVCSEGPRFETPAEIRMYNLLGGHLVGMTGVPEVVLARELGMCYATLALVTNEAAGISKEPLTHSEVIATMNMLGKTVAKLVENTFKSLDSEQTCYCSTGSREAGMF